MPITRSIARMAAQTTPPVVNIKRKRAPKHKHQTETADSDSDSAAAAVATKRAKSSSNNQIKSKRSKAKAKPVEAEEQQTAAPRTLVPPSGEELAPIPAELTFSLADANAHLVRADPRFRDVFAHHPCKPFENLESVHPFRTLCTSIIGQQISWSAARAVQHKFLRLYFPELPEKPDDDYWAKSPKDVFPTAYQVATTDLATLKTAGLSGRKAEYVRDLATRFADGRLTNQKLLVADDEELFKLLTAVYGIGKWTVEMFAIFSLRRPDILPVGDLGVQRGVLHWMLSLHQPAYRIAISSKKLPSPTQDPPPLPMGLTVASLRSRLGGKKKIKGAIFTPAEMEALTESWRPYRSIGVYYMWSLAEEKAES